MVLSYHETEKIETENRRLLLNQSIINGINLREQGNDKRCDYVLFVGLKRLIKRKLSDAWTEDPFFIGKNLRRPPEADACRGRRRFWMERKICMTHYCHSLL